LLWIALFNGNNPDDRMHDKVNTTLYNMTHQIDRVTSVMTRLRSTRSTTTSGIRRDDRLVKNRAFKAKDLVSEAKIKAMRCLINMRVNDSTIEDHVIGAIHRGQG